MFEVLTFGTHDDTFLIKTNLIIKKEIKQDFFCHCKEDKKFPDTSLFSSYWAMKCYPGKQGPLITKDALQFQKSMLYNSPNVFLIEGNVKENISNMLLLLYIGDQLLNIYSRTLSAHKDFQN